MRRTLLILTLFAALPAQAAHVESFAWLEPFQELPVAGGAAVEILHLPNATNGQLRDHPLPEGFLFQFDGATYDRLHIGGKGYVAFGGGQANTARPDALLSADRAPSGVIAAWWGDHHCDEEEGELRTQVVGAAPDRWYVIEWSCSARLSNETVGSDTRFEAQLWLKEGSSVARARYGRLLVDDSNDWEMVSWGLKPQAGAGALGPSASGALSSCNPAGAAGGLRKCRAKIDFPSQAALQYHRSTGPDLIGSVELSQIVFQPASLFLEVEVGLQNIGDEEIDGEGIGFDLYFTNTKDFDPAGPESRRIHRRVELVSVERSGATSVTSRFTISPPANGEYFLCLDIDPQLASGDTDRSNNRSCSLMQVPIGPDLVGSIGAPPVGEAGMTVEIPIEISNTGSSAAVPFGYRIRMIPDPIEGLPQSLPALEVHLGRVDESLDPSGSWQERLSIELPQGLRGDRYSFELSLDPARENEESNRLNNVSLSETKMINRKPRVTISRESVELRFPEGCFYGEPLEATFEICNSGEIEAWNFQPGLAMGADDHLGRLTDAIAASAPQSCLREGTANFSPCTQVGGRTPICSFEVCRIPCETQDDCEAGFFCSQDPELAATLAEPEAKSCMLALGVGGAGRPESCRTVTAVGRIPLTDRRGKPHVGGMQRFHLVDDLRSSLSETLPDVVSSDPVACEEALPDLVAAGLEVPERLIAGGTYPITRSIRNVGFVERPADGGEAPLEVEASYAYFLSTSPFVSAAQIPLELVGGGAGERGLTRLPRRGHEQRTELIRVPRSVREGAYYLAMVVDPGGEVRELSKGNNVYVFPSQVYVGREGLQIETAHLPAATRGERYHHSMIASGATGSQRWSAEGLPRSFALSPDGALAGSAEEEGLYPVWIQVEAGGSTARELFAIRVLPEQSPLSVATKRLPPAVRNQPYAGWVDELGRRQEGIRLAASGGSPPYRWELDQGVPNNRLPEGLRGPTPEGRIDGVPTTLSRSADVVVSVIDSQGGRATSTLTIAVIGAADLRLEESFFEEARTAAPYESCVAVVGGASVDDLVWSVGEGALPPGLRFESRGREGCVVGMPQRCGAFSIPLDVADAQGQTAAAALSLVVSCERLVVPNRALGSVARGEEVSMELSTAPTREVRWALHGGALPDGLSLSEGGSLSGTVSEEADPGGYDFSVVLEDPEGRLGIAAFSLRVLPEQREGVIVHRELGGGCGAARSTSGLGIAMLFSIVPMLRRRSSGRSWRAAGRWSLRGLIRLPEQVSRGLFLLFVLPAALGAACDGTTTEQILDRCAEVACLESFRCDPADGVCKCGGEPCRQGQACAQTPAPHCVATLCAFASCAPAETCEPETGRCLCGAAPCGPEMVCEDGACVAEDRCNSVVCPEGERCDSESGACACDGGRCGEDASCVEGVCVFNRCAGVHCGPEERCSQEDGRCHCGAEGGPICGASQVCVRGGEESLASCEESSLCADVVCGGGTSCDPNDGQCRCGGFGESAPICSLEESCHDGRCVGGDLCMVDGAPKECAGLSSCDPSDGACKCGGSEGRSCGGNEVCLTFEEGLRCAQICDPLSPEEGCGAAEACFWLVGATVYETAAVCAAPGSGGLGSACERSDDCRASLFCSAAGRCRALCDLSLDEDSCPHLAAGTFCAPVPNGPEHLGFCAGG